MKNNKSYSAITVFLAILLTLSSFAFAGCGGSATSSDSPWFKTWYEAVEKANENEQNILIFFSQIGEDENGNPLDEQSKAINDAFGKNSFKKKIAPNYVLLNIDLSNPETKDYAEYIEYMELLNKFSIQAVPTIILATPEQYVINYIAYPDTEQSPAKIVSKIASFSKQSKEVTKARKQLEEAVDLDRVKAIDNLISCLSPEYRYLVIDLLSEIKEIDPEDETGLVQKYVLSFAYVDAIGEFGQGNAQGAIDIFLNVAESENISTDDAQEAYMTACYLMSNTGLGTPETLLEIMQKAYDLNPNSKIADDIKSSISYVKQFVTIDDNQNSESDEETDSSEDNAESGDNAESEENAESVSE